MNWRNGTVLLLSFPVLGSLFFTGCEPKPPIGHDEPVTTSRLVGTRLTDIRIDDLAWQFDESTVTINKGSEPLPKDIATEVVGTEGEHKEITAAWKYDDTESALVLTEIKVDGEPVEGERSIDVTPAGPIRVNLGSRQYNMEKVKSAAAP